MSLIPNNPVTMDDLMEWDRLKTQLAAVTASEMLLRKKIASALFPTPVEGINKFPLANGYVLDMTHVINRKIDEPLFRNLMDDFRAKQIPVNDIVERKPSLVMRVYRTLTAEQAHFFDNALTIMPGSPQLKITLPASAKAKAE